jgi:hypothetical protein
LKPILIGVLTFLLLSTTAYTQFNHCSPHEIIDIVLIPEDDEFHLGSYFALYMEVHYANGEKALVREGGSYKRWEEYKGRRIPRFNFDVSVEGGYHYKGSIGITGDVNKLPGNQTSAIVTVRLKNHPKFVRKIVLPIGPKRENISLFFAKGKKQKDKRQNGERVDVFVRVFYQDTIELPFLEQTIMPTPILHILLKSRDTDHIERFKLDPRISTITVFSYGSDGVWKGENGGDGGKIRIFADQSLKPYLNCIRTYAPGGDAGSYNDKKGKVGEVEYIYRKVKEEW